MKVLIIGLDGVGPEILSRWLNELPNLKRVMQIGVYGKLKSVIPPLTAPAWASFTTGKNPGKHGVFDFVYPTDSLSNIKTVSSADIKGETYYEILSKKGKKNIIINMPVTFPPRTDDIIITSMQTPGKKFIFPEKIIEEIPELKKYRLDANADYANKLMVKELIQDMFDVEEKRFMCAKKLFARKWDTFFILFSATDWAQHSRYTEMIHQPEKAKDVLQLFKKIDSYVGWFVDNMPKKTNLIIMSDHGFAMREGIVAVNKVLKDNKLLSIKAVKKEPFALHRVEKQRLDKQRGIRIHASGIYELISRNPFLFKIASKLYQHVVRIFPVKLTSAAKPDLSKTIAYMLTPSQGIYINSKKRFKDGVVLKYEKAKKDVLNLLKDLKDSQGRPAFKFVKTREQMYKGSEVYRAPDIIMERSLYNMSTRFFGNTFIRFQEKSHDIDGVFFMYGPDIKKARFNAEIIDLAPTILFMMNMPVPKDMDGKVLKKAFKGRLLKQKVKYKKIDKTAAEKQRIKEVLGRIKL